MSSNAGAAEFGQGSRAPFTQVPDWIVLADISNNAKVLYWHVAMHMNFQRGDRAAWPSRATLARRMGYSRADKVDPLIRELVAIGAMAKVRHQRTDGGNANNRYLVNALPPENYQGHASLTEAYEHDRARYADTPLAPKSGPGSEQGERAKPQVIPRPRNEGQGGPRDEGYPRPRNQGPNKKKKNQTKNNPPTGTASHTSTGTRPAENEGGDRLREDTDQALIADVLAVRPGWSETAIRGALSLPEVLARPAAQRGLALLALAADSTTVHPNRLAIDGPWWATAAVTARPARPKWCGKCDENDRYLDTPDGLKPCPSCHPRAVNGDLR
jgi:hypothetical protein